MTSGSPRKTAQRGSKKSSRRKTWCPGKSNASSTLTLMQTPLARPAKMNRRRSTAMVVDDKDKEAFAGQSITNDTHPPPSFYFFKMVQNLNLRCVLGPIPLVLGPNLLSNQKKGSLRHIRHIVCAGLAVTTRDKRMRRSMLMPPPLNALGEGAPGTLFHACPLCFVCR